MINRRTVAFSARILTLIASTGWRPADCLRGWRPSCATGILGLALVGSGAIDASAGDLALEGTWQLEAIDSVVVSDISGEQVPFFEVKGSGIKGYDGCNRFFGSLDKPGAIVSTRRACPDSMLKLPLDLNDLDAHLQTGCLKDDQLTIPADDSYPSSSYRRQFGASAAAGSEPSDALSEDVGPDPHKRAGFEAVENENRAKLREAEAKPGAQPAAVPSEGVGPDPHKRGGFKAVQERNRAKLREAEARSDTKPGEDCD